MNKEQEKNIIKKAKIRARQLARLREDPRFAKVIGRLVHEGLLDTRHVRPSRSKPFVEEVLWVGENLEPRVLELLPAIALKRPRMLMDQVYPDDLRCAMNDLRRGEAQGFFRGVELRKCLQWVPIVGRKNHLPTAMKTFRLGIEEQELLRKISTKKGITESQVIRDALHRLAAEMVR